MKEETSRGTAPGDQLATGAEEIGLPLEEHMMNVAAERKWLREERCR